MSDRSGDAPRGDAPRGDADAIGDAMAAGVAADELDHGRAMAAVKRGLFDLSGSAHAPIVVSRYVLLECIGTGGLGVVFAAYDPSLDRRVAIKLLQRRPQAGEDEEAANLRLVEEAQALAQLAHPNVVAVHDVGTYTLDHPPQGAQPRGVFLVMEYVEGDDLGLWGKARPRSWREVVAMYVAAGRGLEAAHRAGIVHRDFKPNNVLVGRDGRARVLDFGLAHGRTRRGGTPSTIGGTPAYMSPEQHEGHSADAPSDQFSFCVALFEAATGRHPYAEADSKTLAHAKRTGAITPAPLPMVPWRLLAILRKGLSPLPDDRHRDMGTLLARLESVASLRRLKIAAGVAATAITVAATSVLASGRSTEACSDFAAVAAETWNPTTRDELVAALTVSGRSYGSTTAVAVARSLDGYIGEWIERRTAACEATFVRRVASATQMNRVTSCLDRNLERAAELVAVLRRAESTSTEWAVDAVDALPAFSACSRIFDAPDLVQTAATRAMEQSLARAETLFETWELPAALAAATAIEREAIAADNLSIAARASLLVGRVHLRAGRLAPGTTALFSAQANAERTGDQRVAANALVELALAAIDAVSFTDAERHLVLAQAKISHHELGGRLDFDAHYARAKLARLRGSGDESVAVARLALELARNEFPEGHSAHGRAHTLLGITLLDVGEHGRAREELLTARSAYETRLGPDHPHVANVIDLLATIDSQSGHHEAAVEQHFVALAVRERALGPDHAEVGYSFANIAAAEQALGRSDAALEHGRKALAILQAARGEDDPEVAAVMSNLANVMLDLGSNEEALATADTAIAMASRSLGADHPRTAIVVATSGIALTLLDRIPEAVARLTQARESIVSRLGPHASAVPILDKALAEAELQGGDLDRARAHIVRAVAGLESGVHDPRDLASARMLAALLDTPGPTAAQHRALESEWIAAGRTAADFVAVRQNLEQVIARARAGRTTAPSALGDPLAP